METGKMIQRSSGFSAVEAVVSLAVLSVAMVGFLSAMTAATKVSNEELTESDIQANTRKLMEELTRDLDSASICYIPPWGTANLGAPITTSDTDNGNNSYILLRYQFPVVANDPNNQATFGIPTYPMTYGAVASGANAITPGSCYTLLFKRDKVINFVKEVDPATNPAPVVGTRYVYKDLDGDGNYNTTFVVGHVERRFSATYSIATPSTTSVLDVVEKEYPDAVLLEWDTAGSSPKNTMFSWRENPGSSSSKGAPTGSASNWFDNCFHMYTNGGLGESIPQKGTNGLALYANNWVDSTNNGQWDPILDINLRFLMQPDDGHLGDTKVRLKTASTSLFLRSQNKQ